MAVTERVDMRSKRQWFCGLAIVTCAAGIARLVCGQDGDDIADRLDAARAAFGEEIERLRTDLVTALETREDAARKAGNKPVVDRVKQEREAFEVEDELPTVVSSARYSRGIVAARSRLIAALKSGIKDYLQAKQDEQADALQAELEALQAEQPQPMAKAKPGAEPTVVAEWAHEVIINGNVNSRHTYRMYSNGRINSPEGRATWRRQGLLLILRIPSEEAPGGAWVDVCRLAADGKSYTGKNQKGYTIRGVQIARDAPEKETK